MSNMKKVPSMFLMVIASILLSTNVLAYVDPSTGGILFNTIWPFLVAFFTAVVAFMVKWFWIPIKNSYSKVFR